MQMRLFENPQTAKLYINIIPDELLGNKKAEMIKELDKAIEDMQMQQQAALEQQVQVEQPDQNVSGGNELSSNQIDDTAMAIAELAPDEQAEVLQNLGVTNEDRRRIQNAM